MGEIERGERERGKDRERERERRQGKKRERKDTNYEIVYFKNIKDSKD